VPACLLFYRLCADPSSPSCFFFSVPQTKPQVIAVGPGKAGEDGKPASPPSLSVGSIVLYSKYAGTEFKNPRSDEEFVVVSSSDVLATVA
jgi:co-chaperonin GroES (HSP10)